MVKAKAGDLAVIDTPYKELRECATCLNWMPLANGRGAFGQCMLSGKALAAPIVTTDKASCSGWVARGN